MNSCRDQSMKHFTAEQLEEAARAWQEDSNLLGLIGGRYWTHIRNRDQ